MPRIIIPPTTYTIAEAARLTGIAWQTIGDRCAKHGPGPYTYDELRHMAASGAITADTMVRKHDEAWASVASVPGLYGTSEAPQGRESMKRSTMGPKMRWKLLKLAGFVVATVGGIATVVASPGDRVGPGLAFAAGFSAILVGHIGEWLADD
jgi:hypothetical protein